MRFLKAGSACLAGMDDVLKGTSKPTATKREHRRCCRAWRDGPRRAAVASGGIGADSYTLAVGHQEGAHFVIDLARGIGGKFDPDIVTPEYAALLREHRAFQVTGDSYAAQWVAGA